MPKSSDILLEIQQCVKEKQVSDSWALDFVRKRYLLLMADRINMPVICYVANFNHPAGQIDLTDIHSLMGMLKGLEGSNLCLFLHSPGGSFDATDELVQYLHSKFSNIEVIVPLHAFSCATLITCACSKIYMGKQSCLGPIDPQIPFVGANGRPSYTAAQDIIDQFEMAKKDCLANSKNVLVWQPILQQYAPALIRQCQVAKERSEEMAKQWLKKYQNLTAAKARGISRWLIDRSQHHSHARPLCFEELKKKGMNVYPLEADNTLQDYALSLLHAYMFSLGQHAKIIENSIGTIQVIG